MEDEMRALMPEELEFVMGGRAENSPNGNVCGGAGSGGSQIGGQGGNGGFKGNGGSSGGGSSGVGRQTYTSSFRQTYGLSGTLVETFNYGNVTACRYSTPLGTFATVGPRGPCPPTHPAPR